MLLAVYSSVIMNLILNSEGPLGVHLMAAHDYIALCSNMKIAGWVC